MDASKRLNSGFDSGRGMSLDYAGSGMDRGFFDSATCGLNSERYFFTFILRMCFHSH